MVAALRQVRTKLGARAVSVSPIADFAQSVEGDDREALIRSLQDKADVLKLQSIHDEATEGSLQEAHRKLAGLTGGADSSLETKFNATLEEERVEFLIASRSGAPQGKHPQIRLRTAQKLLRLTKKGPAALKFFALIAEKAGELDVLTFRDFGLFMNWRAREQRSDGDPFAALHIATERLRSTHQIIKKYSQCVRLARYGSTSKHRWALPRALLRVVQSTAVFIMRLRIEGQHDAANQYRESAMQFCRMAVWIAERNRDDQSLSLAVTASLLLAAKPEEQAAREGILAFARETLSQIKDPEQAEATLAALKRGIKRMSGERVEGDAEPDLERQIIENLAAGLGIDMTDSENPAVKLIRLGIKDANPERAIKHCIHAFVSISGRVPLSTHFLSELVQLPSINAKILHCDLHDYAVEARTLDIAARFFKEKYCDACKDISPRPAGWTHSDDWQEEENTRHEKFMGAFYERRYGA
jgi:hypothetical protein